MPGQLYSFAYVSSRKSEGDRVSAFSANMVYYGVTQSLAEAAYAARMIAE